MLLRSLANLTKGVSRYSSKPISQLVPRSQTSYFQQSNYSTKDIFDSYPPFDPNYHWGTAEEADDFMDRTWNSRSEFEKKQFALIEEYPERYPKMCDRILWYKAIGDEEDGMLYEAHTNFKEIVKRDKSPELKSLALKKIEEIEKKLFNKGGKAS